jgi:hypothetical protein
MRHAMVGLAQTSRPLKSQRSSLWPKVYLSASQAVELRFMVAQSCNGSSSGHNFRRSQCCLMHGGCSAWRHFCDPSSDDFELAALDFCVTYESPPASGKVLEGC